MVCGCSSESTITPAGMVFAVAEYPRFPDWPLRQRRFEQAGQTPAAPETILINRLESQGIQKRFRHLASPYFSAGVETDCRICARGKNDKSSLRT